MTKKLIMLVEDDTMARLIAGRAIKHAGYELEEYENGLAAFEKLLQLKDLGKINDFGLIVSDMYMPGLNGIQLADRCLAEGIGLPFVLMSGQSITEKQYPSNVKDFLAKPISLNEYKRAIDSYILP